MDKARKDVGTYVSRCLVWKHSLSLCIHEDQGGLVQGLLLAVCPEQFVKDGSFLHLEWYPAPILQNAHVFPSSQHVQGREPFVPLCYRVMTLRQDHSLSSIVRSIRSTTRRWPHTMRSPWGGTCSCRIYLMHNSQGQM